MDDRGFPLRKTLIRTDFGAGFGRRVANGVALTMSVARANKTFGTSVING